MLSLAAALVYGAADFCGGLATKRTPSLVVALLSQTIGFAVLLVALPFTPGRGAPADYLFGALAGVCGAIAIALLYHALSIGKMGIVSPITAVIAAAFPLVFGIVRGEHLALAQIVGLILALVAIVTVSLSFEPPATRAGAIAGVREAIATGLLFGGFFILLSYTHRAAGLHSLLAARMVSIPLLLLVALLARAKLAPYRSDWPLIAACGVMDMGANVLYVLATFNGYLAIVAVLTSLYPASTVLLARFVLNERLTRIQKAGVAIAIAGVLLISLR